MISNLNKKFKRLAEKSWKQELADWFARNNVDDVTMYTIHDENKPFQTGSVLYECAKLTGVLYGHRVIFSVDGLLTQC